MNSIDIRSCTREIEMDYNRKCSQIRQTCGQTRIENKLQNIIFGGNTPSCM